MIKNMIELSDVVNRYRVDTDQEGGGGGGEYDTLPIEWYDVITSDQTVEFERVTQYEWEHAKCQLNINFSDVFSLDGEHAYYKLEKSYFMILEYNGVQYKMQAYTMTPPKELSYVTAVAFRDQHYWNVNVNIEWKGEAPGAYVNTRFIIEDAIGSGIFEIGEFTGLSIKIGVCDFAGND